MASKDELFAVLSDANAALAELQCMPSCSASVRVAAEQVGQLLVRALQLRTLEGEGGSAAALPPVAAAAAPPPAAPPPVRSRHMPPPRRPSPTLPDGAPSELPQSLAALCNIDTPAPASDRVPEPPHAAPAPPPPPNTATAPPPEAPPAAQQAELPAWLEKRNKNKQLNGGPSAAPLALSSSNDFPALGGGGAAGGAGGAGGAWGRSCAPTLTVQPAPSPPQRVASSAPLAPPTPLAVAVANPARTPGAWPRRLGDGFAGALAEPRDDAEWARIRQVSRCASFEAYDDRDRRRTTNIMAGLELHKNVLNANEQERLLDFIKEQLARGRGEQLPGRTFSAPRKWMKGKGRITIQYGVCYSYAHPQGITDDVVEAMPKTLEDVIDRMVRWGVLPAAVRPDSCIINIYEEADCIPPHIDHHDFTRPFCSMSLLSEAPIVFGTRLDVVNEGEFRGAFSLPLPVGSVVVLKGAAADVAKHAIPSVPLPRVSITFRKMSDSKRPLARTVPFRGDERRVLE